MADRDSKKTDLHRTQVIEPGKAGTEDDDLDGGGRIGCITVIRGRGNDLGKHRVVDRRIVIGRDAACDFVIEDFGASRRHCRISREGTEQWTVEDLKSTNGTRINGIKIRGARSLVDGEKIFIGSTVLRFQLYDTMDLKFSSQVTHLLSTDPLTGLQSKRTFDDALDYAVTGATRAGEPLSLMMMDMDGIKSINDRYGHLFGAFSIEQAGQVIARVLEGLGQASRFGGDEFTAFVRGRGKTAAVEIAEKIRSGLDGARLEKDGIPLHPTISIGVATLPEDGADVLALVNAADKALYEAKAGGKNRVCEAEC